jgi:hypothetical protein
MSTKHLLDVVVDTGVLGQTRIQAIQQLDAMRLQEKEQLGVLSGKKELLQVIRSEDRIDVRCQAAAALAKTDSRTALAWCNQMLKDVLESVETRVRIEAGQPQPTHVPIGKGIKIPFPTKSFANRVCQLPLMAAGSKDVLVVNTACEIPMSIKFGPVLNRDGWVTMKIELDVDAVGVDVEKNEVYLDALFLPMSPPKLLGSFRITRETELLLQAQLESSALEASLERTGQDLIDLPEKAFAFRIWWKEG